MSDFKLSASLKGHEDDVRGVAFPTSDLVFSASRDATVRSWRLKAPNQSPPTFDDTIAVHGSEFINSLTHIPPSKDFPEGLVVSGGKDTIIDVRQPGRPPDVDAERLLLGHQGNVCALDYFDDGNTSYLVSGSWDASAMVWDVSKAECTATLQDHSGSVWAVLAYGPDRIITGCADHKIRVFSRTGKLINTISGSSDVVRALCRLPESNSMGAHFASAGNDAIIRLWTLDGKQVAQLHGHDNFIYSLDMLPSGELLSAGEDRTARVWRDGHNIQTITHPAISVWAVAACKENGDIVTGASDRMVRVFSRAKERLADPQTLTEFEDSVKGSAIPRQTMGDVKKDELPGPEFLKQKSGTKEGQVQMIREANGSITAHQWSHLAQQWINVGTVVEGAGSSGRKTSYMGKDYDYVFDVDIAEGQPPLKLPYNLSENPYEVATKFIADNELPQSYLQQVASFIIQNTEGASMGQGGSSAPPQPATETRKKVLPQTEYLTITQANLSLISGKVQELNAKLLSDGRKDVAFSPTDIKMIPTFTQALSSALNKPTSSDELKSGAAMVVHIATKWPIETRLPGLDLLRCVIAAYPDFSAQHDPGAILDESGAFPSADAQSAGNPNLTMLGIRAVANLAAHVQGRKYLRKNLATLRSRIAPFMQPSAGAPNRNILIAATTFYINVAVLQHEESASVSEAQTLLADLAALLANPKIVDSEAVYRALVAVGTLVRIPGARGGNAQSVEDAVKAAAGRVKEPRVRGVVDEMMSAGPA